MTKCGVTCDYEPTPGGYIPPQCDTCLDLAIRQRNRQLAELAKGDKKGKHGYTDRDQKPREGNRETRP